MCANVIKYLLCGAGCIVVAGQVHAQHSLSARWISYAGDEMNVAASDAVCAIATDSRTNAYFGGRLGVGVLKNTGGVDTADAFGAGLVGVEGNGFVAKAGTNGILQWASCLSYGEVNGEGSVILGLAHADNAVYAGGAFKNYTDFDYDIMNGGDGDTRTDAILAKLDDGTGGVVWSHALGETENADRYCTVNGYAAVAADAGGNIYAAGHTAITNLQTFLPDSAHAGGTDAVVVKYTPGGTVSWVRYLGGANEDRAATIAVGADGAVYVAGQTRSPGWATLGDNTLPSPSNAYGFLAKLDSAGTVVYSALLGGGGTDKISAILKDASSGTLILAGQTSSPGFCAGLAANAMSGTADGFVMGLADLGDSIRTNWFRFVGGSGNKEEVTALAWMGNGQVIAGGFTDSGGWLAPQGEAALGYSGMSDGFLLQLDKDTGAPLWSTYAGGAMDDKVYALATQGGTVYAGGDTFSPGFAYGGFWDEWDKDGFFGDFAYGFIGRWTQGVGLPPDIVQDLEDIVIHEGQDAVFTLLAQASPSPAYHWTTNGIPVAGAATQYTIPSAMPSHDGTMVCCVASNVFGCTTSHVARLTVIADGSLTVSLAPAEAIAQGARWSIDDGGTWFGDGHTAILRPDDYTVTFTNIAGWTTPTPQAAAVSSSAAASNSATYTPILATAARTIADTNVTLAITVPPVPPGATEWTLVETLPPNVTPTVYDSSGAWNGTTRTLTFTNTTSATVSYTVSISVSGSYAISGSIISAPSGMSCAVTGDTQVIKANLIRVISGAQVTILMLQPQSSANWSVSDFLPDGLAAIEESIAGLNGGWDGGTSEVYWYGRSVGQTLSYEVTGAPGTYYLTNGVGSVTSTGAEPIFGDTVLVIPDPNVPAVTPDILSFSVHGGLGQITFASAVNQAYMVLTNAMLTLPGGWHDCLPVTGTNTATAVTVPAAAPALFYRIEAR